MCFVFEHFGPSHCPDGITLIFVDVRIADKFKKKNPNSINVRQKFSKLFYNLLGKQTKLHFYHLLIMHIPSPASAPRLAATIAAYSNRKDRHRSDYTWRLVSFILEKKKFRSNSVPSKNFVDTFRNYHDIITPIPRISTRFYSVFHQPLLTTAQMRHTHILWHPTDISHKNIRTCVNSNYDSSSCVNILI